MSTDFRALCAELAAELERCRPLAEVPDCLARARAALAKPVAAPARPTDDELWDIGERHLWTGTDESVTNYRILTSFIEAARAVLARYGHQPAPPAAEEVGYAKDVRRMCDIILGNTFGNEELDSLALLVGHHADVLNAAPPVEGEVADEARYLAKELRDQADDLSPSLELFGLIHRAADLLEQRHPTPVPVASDIYFEFVISDADYCTQAGGIAPTYAQALSEGQHYLAQCQQDGPHTLELRRVEVLNPDALPLPAGEVQP